MKKLNKTFPRLLTLGVLMVLASSALANGLHPEFPLLDKKGLPVIESGQALSTMVTCGECHDTAFIAASSDHADAGAAMLGQGETQQSWEAGPGYFGGWDPMRYDNTVRDDGTVDLEAWLKRYGPRHAGGGPATGMVEMDCLLCHTDISGKQKREDALMAGEFEWANSARLMELGVLMRWEGLWQWNPESFDADGSLHDGVLDIHKPKDANCGQCHGQVDNSLEVPLIILPDPEDRPFTDRSGQIISPQKLVNSGLNISGKEKLNHAFDVHSDRVVGCVNCHYSLNNPVYFRQREESRPDHLVFDPRRLSSADYLSRPMHQFAKGHATHGLAAVGSENSLRRCESCHEAVNVHEWLPYRERHFASLACESCHVPKLYGPALQTLDWTMLDAQGKPLRQYREVDGDVTTADGLIAGFRPVMMARANVDREQKLAPFNLVTSWFWLSGAPARPVPREALEAALLSGEGFHPDVLAALDRDGDGALSGEELRLDDESRLEAIRRRLEDSGLEQVSLSSEITPYPVSHNVVNGQWATRDCSTCHGEGSILAAGFTLADYRPGGIAPSGSDFSSAPLTGEISSQDDGRVEFQPDTRASGYYIIGLHNVEWIDLLGLAMFFGITLGVTGHGILRYIANRRRPRSRRLKKRTRMYDRYERLWHWLQALTILLLLATGLIIHKPHIFSMFSFAYIVQVHNVLGFIVLINAALALFWTLTTGEIRQYFPEPKGFLGRSLAQAMYYSRGIFAGEPHPLEKTKERKLNPLQQITYLAILNVLLPAQVITGVLVWGMQKWPQLATALGGLPVLAPIHTLVAWAFSAFIVMHVYLTTAAGDTPGAGIKSMITGWEDVEEHAPSEATKTDQADREI